MHPQGHTGHPQGHSALPHLPSLKEICSRRGSHPGGTEPKQSQTRRAIQNPGGASSPLERRSQRPNACPQVQTGGVPLPECHCESIPPESGALQPAAGQTQGRLFTNREGPHNRQCLCAAQGPRGHARRQPLHGSGPRHNPLCQGSIHHRSPATASGTLNPLCRVLCTFRSVYLLAIGPMSVCSLATDMPGRLTYSPKQLDSRVWRVCTPWLRTPTSPLDRRAVAQVSRTIPGHSDSGSAP